MVFSSFSKGIFSLCCPVLCVCVCVCVCMCAYVCVCVCVCVSTLVVSDSLWPHRLVAWQDPLSMEFSRQEYWNEFPCLSPGDFPDPGILYCLSQGNLQLLHSTVFSFTSLVKLGGLFSVCSSLIWECCSEFCLRLFSPFLIPLISSLYILSFGNSALIGSVLLVTWSISVAQNSPVRLIICCTQMSSLGCGLHMHIKSQCAPPLSFSFLEMVEYKCPLAQNNNLKAILNSVP